MDILIIEDESRAANRLERLILNIEPDFNIVAKAESVKEAISILETPNDIKLIFSDIELGDGVSFEIFHTLNIEIPIIFTTAFNQYAIEAFKVNGVDYLLKPIEENQLVDAIAKYKRTQGTTNPVDLTSISLAIANLQKKPKKSRYLVKIGDKFKSIQVTEVAAFYSMAKGSYLMTKDKRNYPLDLSLDQIMTDLDTDTFYKISRKHIVALDAIEDIIAFSNSRLVLKISGMEGQELIVAREKVKEFKGWLG